MSLILIDWIVMYPVESAFHWLSNRAWSWVFPALELDNKIIIIVIKNFGTRVVLI